MNAAQTRRTRPGIARRIRTFWIPIVAAAVSFVLGAWLLATTPYFRVKSIGVSRLDHLERAAVISLAAIPADRNVWFLDRGAVARRLEGLPYVKTAAVVVRPPASVWLNVIERRATACVRDAGGADVTVDDELRVLEQGCADSMLLTYRIARQVDAPPATFLRDAELGRLQRDARALTATGDRYRQLSHDGYGDLEAVRPDGIAVKFGDDGDLRTKQRLIRPLFAAIGAKTATVRALDLRAPTTPVVEYRK